MKPSHPQLEEHFRKMDALPARTLCAFCGWEFYGSAVEGREEAAQHRRQAHPDLIVQRRRRGGNLKSFHHAPLKKQDWNEIYAERDKRARLLGIDVTQEKT